jgi:8-oxo-dGTP diphosphatase
VGILRCGDDILMVRQAGPGEEPVWTVPGGRAEPGELAAEALVREVREETGVHVDNPGRVAFLVQVDNRQDDWLATVWTFDVAAWSGEIAVDDPDGFVSEAAWVEQDGAIARLKEISWHVLTADYLRGGLDSRPAWFRRVHEDGREELL